MESDALKADWLMKSVVLSADWIKFQLSLAADFPSRSLAVSLFPFKLFIFSYN